MIPLLSPSIEREKEKENIQFQRIDADVTNDFKEEVSADELKDETDALTELFTQGSGQR